MSSSLSARVLLPWSICAIMQKLRVRSMFFTGRFYHDCSFALLVLHSSSRISIRSEEPACPHHPKRQAERQAWRPQQGRQDPPSQPLEELLQGRRVGGRRGGPPNPGRVPE